MYLSPDDARSDAILAAATTIVGVFAVRLIAQLPFYPQRGALPLFLAVAWVFALSGLVPWLLSRHRGDGAAAFGLAGDRSGWTGGLPLVVVVAGVGVVLSMLRTGNALTAVLGPLAGLAAGTGAFGVARALEFVALSAGALLLATFLAVRGTDGFRPIDVSLTQWVRTIGMGGAGVALVLGLARSIGAPQRLLTAVVNAVGLAVLTLLVDRLVPARETVPRGTLLAPVVVVVVAHVFAAGGFIFGDLVTGLYTGALGAGAAMVIATLVNLKRGWAAVPFVIALHWWPTCFSPLAFGSTLLC